MLQNLFTTVVGISIPVSIIVLLLTFTSPLMKKTYAAKWRYMIWIVLAVRLVIPFNIAVSSPPVNLTIPEVVVFGQPNISANPDSQLEQTGDTPEQISISNETSQTLSLQSVLSVIWIIGIAFFALRQIFAYTLFKKKMRRWNKHVKNNETIALFDRLCIDLKIRKKPILRQNAYASSPMMYGFINPVLVLQSGEYDEHNSEVILKHELVHYKRHDLWYKLVLLFANAIHWFNPFIYVIVKSANKDIEYSCDDEVVKNADIAFRKKYSQAILNSMHRGQTRNILLSTQFKGGKKNIKNRFANILDTAKKRNGIVAICVILVLVLVGGMFIAFTNAVTTDKITLLVSPASAKESADNMEDMALISMLQEILYKNAFDLYANWFTRDGYGLDLAADSIFIAGIAEYYEVKNMKDMKELKANCEAVFSRGLLDNSVYPKMFESEVPLFAEDNGKLYYHPYTGGIGNAPDFTRAKVIKKSENAFEIEVPMTTPSDEEGEIFIYKAVQQNGNWVLDSFFFFHGVDN